MSVRAGSLTASTAAVSPQGKVAGNGMPPSTGALHISNSEAGQHAQLSPEQHDNSRSGTEAARESVQEPVQESTCQQSDHGIAGFTAMSPVQQSAAILNKWGVPQPPELQRQLQLQHLEQQQLSPGSIPAPLIVTPSSSQAAQGVSPTPTAAGASCMGAQQGRGHTDPAGNNGHTSSVSPDNSAGITFSDLSHAGLPVPDLPQSHGQIICPTGIDAAAALNEVLSQNQQQAQGDAEAAGRLVPGDMSTDEGGLTLEQPDGEGSAPLVTPEVVRGRVVRATELWHRQRLQQEASQQVGMHLSSSVMTMTVSWLMKQGPCQLRALADCAASFS